MRQINEILLLSLSFVLTAALAFAQPPAAETPAGAPVVFSDETLFMVYDKIGPFTPPERARAIGARLTHLSSDPLTRLEPLTTADLGLMSAILHGETVIMTVTDRDARPLGRTRQQVAQDYAKKIYQALTTSREQVTLRAILIDSALALLDTGILIALLVLFQRAFPKVYARLDAWRGTYIRSIRFQRVEMLSSDQIADSLMALTKGCRLIATLLLFYFYITSVLGLFPWTRGLSAALFSAVLSTLRAIGGAFATFVPDVISIVVIIFVTRYIIKLIHLMFTGIERGAISFAGFRTEWAQPTYKIVRFLVIIFAAIAIFPYIPGSKSEGFRGISVFLGVLLSLGSAGAVSNIIAGIVLTYMRAFRTGDRVRIADTVGDITESTLLVTRIRTIKNVDITIPNAMVLGSHIINFSSSARNRGLILHTSVTIGYDAPWRKVHELLIAAARATRHILHKPEPFVLQTSLNDFYVTYELNALTDQPNLMASIYAELHQNIQDTFNEAGVEIMSPHYTQIRDGNKVTIPEQYLPKNYQAPAFRFWPLTHTPSKSEESASGKDTTA